MFCQISDDKDMLDNIKEYPSKKLEDCGKIRFWSHNNLTLSM